MIYRKQLGVLIGLCLFIGLASLTPTPPKSAGAPAERTGAPTIFTGKEPTCAVSGCHDFFSLNSGNGILSIECIDCDGQYKAGSENLIRVTIQGSGFNKFGFQAVVLEVDSVFNVPVGETVLVDPIRTQILEANSPANWMVDRKYVTHTFDGNAPVSSNSTYWDFIWIAPEGYTDTVTVYASALTANNDLEMTGDYAYTAKLTLGGIVLGVNSKSRELDVQVYPNPATNVLYISGSNNADLMELRVYSLSGVEILKKMIRANESIKLDHLVEGMYLYSLTQDDMLKKGKIIIQ